MLAGPDLLERPRLCADLRDGVHAVPRVGLPRIALALGRWGLALGPDGSVYVSDERRAVVSRPRSGRMLFGTRESHSMPRRGAEACRGKAQAAKNRNSAAAFGISAADAGRGALPWLPWQAARRRSCRSGRPARA